MAKRVVHSYCKLCYAQCPIVCEVEDGEMVRVRSDQGHPMEGVPCMKALAAPEMVRDPCRLKTPLRRTNPKDAADPGWVRVSWDHAMDEIARRLLEIRDRHGAESVFFNKPTSAGSAAGDYAEWMTRLANAFGSPNVVTTQHLCNWHNGVSCQYTYGSGMVPVPDLENARTIVLWGHNPKATHTPLAKRIFQAKKRGAHLIVIDPRKTDMAQMADLWLAVKPGGDGALALSMIHVLIEEGLYDRDFVTNWTNGPFLVREDTGRLLTEQDLIGTGKPDRFVVWDAQADKVQFHDRAVIGALTGSHRICPRDGKWVGCVPALTACYCLTNLLP